MIEWVHEKLKIDKESRADLIAHIRNAPHFRKKDDKVWTYSDFLPDEDDPGMSPEQFEAYMLNFEES